MGRAIGLCSFGLSSSSDFLNDARGIPESHGKLNPADGEYVFHNSSLINCKCKHRKNREEFIFCYILI